MDATIPDSHADLLDKPAFAHMACHLKDGSILCNPVWFTHRGGLLVVNSAVGRLKDRALRRNPTVTLCISDPDNPYRYLEIRGRVETITTEGAETEIDQLASHYLGVDRYPHRRQGEMRVSYRIRPERVVAFPKG
ncbi:MAG: PPOX class F420-dependent oxidoreductase [Ectothiorhodospiraceae bacterium]|nr:PPOX class F420-dependent oxidoreductase [Ectothiorhodospiraceae bacterium]